eukprot:12333324-Heterocapsa_arctica.AAC.1
MSLDSRQAQPDDFVLVHCPGNSILQRGCVRRDGVLVVVVVLVIVVVWAIGVGVGFFKTWSIHRHRPRLLRSSVSVVQQ